MRVFYLAGDTGGVRIPRRGRHVSPACRAARQDLGAWLGVGFAIPSLGGLTVVALRATARLLESLARRAISDNCDRNSLRERPTTNC